MTKADIARKWRKKHPGFNTKKLSRVVYKAEKLSFKDERDAYDTLRYIEGKKGDAKRKSVEKTEFFKKDPRPYNPYKLPKSDQRKYKPYLIRGIKMLLVLSDIHLPYHDVPALTAAIKFAKGYKIDGILLNGDTLDFFGLSRFVRDPGKRDFAGELQMFKDIIAILKKEFPGAKIILKIGNHEERYMHFLWTKASELDGVDEFKLESILKTRANGITIIGEKRVIKANGLNIIHGHEFSHGFFNPVNVARGLYLRAKTSAMQGHSHASSEHTEPDLNQKITTTWSVGCLCELHPQYAPINKWNHGFAIIDLHANGKTFEVTNKRILNGKVL